MLPTRLNLLPKEKQNYVTKIFYVQYLKRYLEVFLIFLSICGVIFVTGDHVLQIYFNNLAVRTTLLAFQNSSKNKQIKQINVVLADVEAVQKIYAPWSQKIAALSEAIPSGITLTALDADKNTKSLNISGVAKTRLDLLELKNHLEKSGLFSAIEQPPEQLTEKENILFSITGKLK
jgi:Tfp pilus assembly protein PilN